MASEILGLFTTPDMYRMQQQEALDRRALQFAQLTPFQRAEMSLYRGGANLASGIGSLLGVEDPQLKLISQRQQLSQGLDVADPNAILQRAQQAAEMGDMQFATVLADYARKAQSEMALAQQRTREGKAAATPKELQIAQARAQLLDQQAQLEAMPDSPEKARSLAVIKNTLAGLTATARQGQIPDAIEIARELALEAGPEGSEAYTKRYRDELKRLSTKEKTEKANIKEVGVAVGSNAPVYLDVNNDQQFTYQTGADGKQMRVPYVGGVDRTTAKTQISVEQKGKEEFIKQLGKNDAKTVTDAIDTRNSSVAALNTLQEMSRLNDQGLISGSYATGRVGASNFLNTLGLIGAKDQVSLASSEQFQKQANDLVLATLGGRLGAGFSNEDRKFIQSIVPQLENSATARRELINFMIKKNMQIVDETTRLEEYARQNNGLGGFKPKIPLAPTPKTGAAAMSDQQLLDALKKAKPKAKGK
jgi:hypothetical protein